MTKRVTIADVAKLAEVHESTVSRALSPATRFQVNVATVERVERAANQLGYVPNVMARGLRKSHSMIIGVIIPDLTNPFFPPIIRGIEDQLKPRGYTALLANTDGDAQIEMHALTSFLERSVDGLIIASGRRGDERALMRPNHDRVFTVMLNRDSGAMPYPLVTGDDAVGIGEAVSHLHALGHRAITHISGPGNLSTSTVRTEAFVAACHALGIAHQVAEGTALSVEAGQASMDQILAEDALRPTAVLASNDLIAVGVLRSMKAHNLSCPRDISVIGFNDMPFADDFCPPLTTIRVPVFDMGVEAARLVLEAIDSGVQEHARVALPVSLVVRESTGPAVSR